MSLEEQGIIAVAKNVGGFVRDIGRMDSSMHGFGKTSGLGATALAGVGAAASLAVTGTAAAAAGLITLGGAGLAASISYESAFTGVLKTTEGTTDAMGNMTAVGEELRQGFIDLSKQQPISANAAARIGELGGQLGISNDHLLDFTKAMSDMSVTTDLTADTAATGFARIANIMGTSQGDFDRMGSSVVELGNNFATTESGVLNFAQRIAGAGQIAGLTEAQVFGIGAAMSSVGIEAEAGGTATQKVLLGINEAVATSSDKLGVFASTAGLSADEFGQLWEQDAGAAFSAFVTGLGDQGDAAVSTLSELGLSDQRLVRSFLSLSNAGGLLNDTMSTSTEAWDANIALSREASLRYGTSASKLSILKNRAVAAGIGIGDALAPAFGIVIDSMLGVEGGTSPLLGAFQRLGDWLTANLPSAIATASDFFNNKLVPAVRLAGDYFTNTLLPAARQAGDWLSANLPPAIATASDFFNNKLVPAFKTVSEKVGLVVTAFTDFRARFSDSTDDLTIKTNTIKAVFQTAWIVVSDVVKAAGDVIFGSVIPAIQESFATLSASVSSTGVTWSQVWDAIGTGFKVVGEIVGAVVLAIVGVFVGLVSGIAAAVNNIVATVTKMADVFQNQLRSIQSLFKNVTGVITSILHGDWSDAFKFAGKAWEDVGDIISNTWEGIKLAFKGSVGTVTTMISGFIDGIIGFFTNLKDRLVGHSIIPDMLDDIVRVWEGVDWLGLGRNAINFIIDGIKGLVSTVLDTMLGLATDAADKVSGFDWLGIGGDIISGIKRGIENGAEAVKNAIGGVAQAALDAARNLLGIHSPSTAFREIGEQIISGLLAGISSGSAAVSSALGGLLSLGGNSSGGVGIADTIRLGVFSLAGSFSGLAGSFARMYSDQVDAATAQMDIADAMLAQQAAAERLLAIDKQRQQINFLQQQLSLIKLVAENGLDPSAIFGGFEFGVNASLSGLLDITSSAMAALIQAANDELQIASPSKRFISMGRQVMAGMSLGLSEGIAGVQQTMSGAVSTLVPAAYSSSNVNQASVTINVQDSLDSGQIETILSNAFVGASI